MKTLISVALATLAALVPSSIQAAYPGDNGHIAFARRGNIYSINAAGAGLERLTSGRDFEGSPVWSPEGNRILFSNGGDTYGNELWIMRANGRREREVVEFRGGLAGKSWRPDGDLIVFATVNRRNPGDLWTVRPDGSRLRRLTRTDASELSPVWSPDGDRIAFIRSGNRGQDVWTMAPDGSDLQRVTERATECDSCGDRFGGFQGLDYSPDGETILFSVNKGDSNVTLWTVDEDGGDPHKILEGRFGTIGGSWSPNGRKIVYSDSPTGTDTFLYKIRADGTHRTRITDSGGDSLDLGADWGPRLSD